MRNLLILLACGQSVAAMASYELLLALDNPGSGGVQVRRFDPVSGTSFGSFGKGYIPNPPYGMAVDQATGMCYVSTFSRTLLRFNYNTGLFLGEYSAAAASGGRITVNRTGQIVWADGGTIRLLDTYGKQQNSFTAAGASSFSSAIQAANGNYYALENNLNRMYCFNQSGSFVSWTGLGTSPYSYNQLSTAGGKVLFSSTDPGAGFRDRLYVFDTTPTGQANFTTIAPTGVGNYSIRGTAIGHDNTAYFSGLNTVTGNYGVGKISLNTGSQYGFFGEGTFTFGLGMQAVVAPEPSTMIIFGMGLSAIVARRRRK